MIKINLNCFQEFCLDVRQAFRSMTKSYLKLFQVFQSMTKSYFKLFQVFQGMRVQPELELSAQVELPLASDL